MLERILKRVLWVVLALVLVIAGVVLDFLRHGGQFRTLEPHFAGSCETVPLQASAEDIQIDRAAGIAYLSALDRRGQVEGRDVRGTVMRMDLNAPPLRAVPALVADPPDFRPHGMSLFIGTDGARRLFVISHPPGKPHTVEVFDRGVDGRFAHAQTIRNPWLVKPNAIVAVSPTQFYLANDSGAHSRAERVSEMLLRRALASLVYYDNGSMSAVGPKIASGAGIAASSDGRQIYVSESNGHRILAFDRGMKTGDLRLRESIEIDGAADNINVAPDGALWVAAHPKVLALARHFDSAQNLAPTRILRIDAHPGADDRVREIYLNAGEQLSAGSVAAAYDGRMLVGSITEPKVLVCRLGQEGAAR